MNKEPKISVCMAMYNAASYLRECIESILSQSFTDFELLIVDDGSTDDSKEIVNSYNDERIRLICNNHDYIAALNFLLHEAKGKYIARMDADDIMLPHRLENQYYYMESNPLVGILATSACYIDSDELICSYDSDFLVSHQDLLYANPIIHPTSFLRTSIVREKKLYYEAKFKYAEDYRFWTQCAIQNVPMAVVAWPSIRYRLSPQQATSKHALLMKRVADKVKTCFAQWICHQSNIAYKKPVISDSQCQLTIIIPFLNEGNEVVETVKSIRQYVANQVEIIVINDMSTDGKDYAALLTPYGVHYWLNKSRLGVAASRDLGVQLSQTPYFLLLDAHMRVYNELWLDDIVTMLSQNDRQLLCMQTRQLWKKEDGRIVELKDVAPVYGAYATFDKGALSPGIEWNYFQKEEQATLQNIPCVLGAGYATSKRYWTYLQGLEGLKHYGSDEVYISFKVWTEGGRCVLLKKHDFGHIYRDNAPYKISQCNFVYNYLLIAYTLLSTTMWCWVLSCCSIARPEDFKEAWSLFLKNKHRIVKQKEYHKSITTVSTQQIMNMNTMMSIQRIVAMDRRKEISLQITQYIQERHHSSYGIVDGKMASLIWLMLWNKQNKVVDLTIQNEWLESIKVAVSNHQLPFNFYHGLCGIGWGFIYLYANQLIDDIDESILLQIDNEIQSVNLRLLDDKTLYYGSAGIIAYVVCRELYNRHKGYNTIYPLQFLQAIHREASHLSRASKEHMAVYYSNLYQYVDEIKLLDDFKPSLEDWITYPTHLPNRPQYWNYSLDLGCLGYTLPIFQRELITLNNSRL